MSLEQNNFINLTNANDLATAISVDAAKVVEVNYNDPETIAIQAAIDAQVNLLLIRNVEIHQPLQREPGEGGIVNAPPVPVSAQVNDNNPNQLIIAFNVNVTDADGTGYSISGSAGATAITAVVATGSILTMTLNGPVLSTETILTSYDGLGSLFNGDYPTIAAPAYTNFPVTNNVQP